MNTHRPVTARTAAIAMSATMGALALGPVLAAPVLAKPEPLSTAVTASSTDAHQRATKVKQKQKKVLKVAFSKRNARYGAGASGPHAFDCSGFALYVYKKALGKRLPHYSGSQMKVTKRVSRKNLQPGDLLFYGSSGSQHVAIYIGRGKQIGANNPRSGIRIESINASWWRGIYAGAGRIIK